MDFLHTILSNLWSALLIVVFFGGSIFVHELGHFLAARRRGMVVECFSIGFGPKIFSWRGKDGVEYRLSWLPLGGYVRLPQLADMGAIEGESKVDASRLTPISYSTKMIVSVAGAVCNVLFAFLLACLVWAVGLPSSTALNTTRIGVVFPTLTLPDGRVVPSPAAQAGIQPGDIIRAVDGKSVNDWLGFMQTLAASSGRTRDGRPETTLTLERAGRTLQVTALPLLAGDEGFRTLGIDSADCMVVDSTVPDSPAALAGLRAGDTLVSVNDVPLYQQDTLSNLIRKNGAAPLRLVVGRDHESIDFTLVPRPEKNADGTTTYRIGVIYQSQFVTLHPSPLAQIADDAVITWRVFSGLINPRSDLGPSKLSGAVGIVRGFNALAQIDIRRVLWFTIFINVNLALLNLLPIPVLDGGHMLFATISRLRGRSLPARLVGATQGTFMVLLLALMVYVNFYDILRWARDSRAENAAEASASAATPAATAPAAPAK